MSKDDEARILAQFLDIILSSKYDSFTNYNERTSESGWTIIKLSATLSAFVDYSEFDTQEE